MSTQEIPNESIPDRSERLFAKPRATSKDQAKEMILDNYYYDSDKNKGKIFLVKQNKFVPLKDLDAKLAEYRRKLIEHRQDILFQPVLFPSLSNPPIINEPFAFQYDFQIMTLLTEHKQTLENLRRDYTDTFNRIINRLGEASLKLILFNPKEAWKPGSEKILEEHANIFESYKGMPNTTMPPRQSPFFIYIKSWLAEPIPSEEPTTLPEQDYLNKLMLESPEFKKTISDAAKTHRAMWRGIIPVDDTRKTLIPYESPKPIAYLPEITTAKPAPSSAPVAESKENYSAPQAPNGKRYAPPFTNSSDLLKALRVNGSEGISELEKGILEVSHDSGGDEIAVPPQVGKRFVDYDPKDCIRDPIDDMIIRCKEAPNKYQECARANRRFKTWQCCKPDN